MNTSEIKAVFPIKIRKLKHYHHCKYNQNCDKWIILSVSVSVCIFLCWAVYLDLSCVSHIFHPSPRIAAMFSTCVWLTPPPFHVAYKLIRVSCGQSFAVVFTGRVCVSSALISFSVWYLIDSHGLPLVNWSATIKAPTLLLLLLWAFPCVTVWWGSISVQTKTADPHPTSNPRVPQQ